MSFADEPDLMGITRPNTKIEGDAGLKARCVEMEARLRSRCCVLVEVGSQGEVVNFLHKIGDQSSQVARGT